MNFEHLLSTRQIALSAMKLFQVDFGVSSNTGVHSKPRTQRGRLTPHDSPSTRAHVKQQLQIPGSLTYSTQSVVGGAHFVSSQGSHLNQVRSINLSTASIPEIMHINRWTKKIKRAIVKKITAPCAVFSTLMEVNGVVKCCCT